MSNNKRSYRGLRTRKRDIANVTSAKDLRRRSVKLSASDAQVSEKTTVAYSQAGLPVAPRVSPESESNLLNFIHSFQALLTAASKSQLSKVIIYDIIQTSLTRISQLLESRQNLLILPHIGEDIMADVTDQTCFGDSLYEYFMGEQKSRNELANALFDSVVLLPESRMKVGWIRHQDVSNTEQTFLLFSIQVSEEASDFKASKMTKRYLDEHLIFVLPMIGVHDTCNDQQLLRMLKAKNGKVLIDDNIYALLRCLDCWLMQLEQILNEFSQQQLMYQLQTTTQTLNDGVVLLNESGIVTSANPAYCKMMDGSLEDFIGHPFRLLDNNRYPPYVEQHIWEEVKEKHSWQGELWNTGIKGAEFLQMVRLTRFHYGEPSDKLEASQKEQKMCLAVINDNSRLHEFENQISHLSNYDPLTNLPNRHLLIENIKSTILEAQDRRTSFAVVVVDLDHFKHINDGLGHPIGDRLLAVIAQGLNQELGRCYDIILARLSGDDFVVVCKNYKNIHHVNAVVASIVEIFQQPFDVGIGRSLFITASIGIALYPEHGTEVNQLLSNADLAMYQAKRSGRNQIKYYSHKMTQNVSDLLELTNQLRSALKLDSELQLYYQPQVDLSSRKTTAVEALMRWFHPELGLISPGRFIPIAENSGLLPELDRYALQHACLQLQKWQEENKGSLRIAVNISQQTFVMGGFIELLQDMIELTQIDPTLLELEITEGALLEPSPIVLDTLEGIKALGVRLAVDDFGTGYSSLAYLHRYHVDKLKIDQSFVQSIEQDNEARVITSSIIQLAAGLGLDVLAEGVETESQLQFLLDNGCDSCQGFIFSRAVPAEDLTTATSCLCPLTGP